MVMFLMKISADDMTIEAQISTALFVCDVMQMFAKLIAMGVEFFHKKMEVSLI
jgi:hypothetical protein